MLLNEQIKKDFTFIKPTTKQADEIRTIASYYWDVFNTSLRQIYGNFSYAKECAYNYCKELANKYNGRLFLGGHNCMRFTAFIYFEADGVEYVAKITKGYNYLTIR